MKQLAGFTLIELLVVMAIIGIIAGVGWPMYIEQGRTSNRTDALLATTAVALALTQYQSDTGKYSWATPPAAGAHSRFLPLVAVGANSGTTADSTCAQRRGFRWVGANNRYESCHGLYSISVSIDGVAGAGTHTGTTFIVTTTAIPTRPQSNDQECNAFTLNSNGTKGHRAIGDPLLVQPGATTNGPFHSTKRCWGSD